MTADRFDYMEARDRVLKRLTRLFSTTDVIAEKRALLRAYGEISELLPERIYAVEAKPPH